MREDDRVGEMERWVSMLWILGRAGDLGGGEKGDLALDASAVDEGEGESPPPPMDELGLVGEYRRVEEDEEVGRGCCFLGEERMDRTGEGGA